MGGRAGPVTAFGAHLPFPPHCLDDPLRPGSPSSTKPNLAPGSNCGQGVDRQVSPREGAATLGQALLEGSWGQHSATQALCCAHIISVEILQRAFPFRQHKLPA